MKVSRGGCQTICSPESAMLVVSCGPHADSSRQPARLPGNMWCLPVYYIRRLETSLCLLHAQRFPQHIVSQPPLCPQAAPTPIVCHSLTRSVYHLSQWLPRRPGASPKSAHTLHTSVALACQPHLPTALLLCHGPIVEHSTVFREVDGAMAWTPCCKPCTGFAYHQCWMPSWDCLVPCSVHVPVVQSPGYAALPSHGPSASNHVPAAAS